MWEPGSQIFPAIVSPEWDCIVSIMRIPHPCLWGQSIRREAMRLRERDLLAGELSARSLFIPPTRPKFLWRPEAELSASDATQRKVEPYPRSLLRACFVPLTRHRPLLPLRS